MTRRTLARPRVRAATAPRTRCGLASGDVHHDVLEARICQRLGMHAWVRGELQMPNSQYASRLHDAKCGEALRVRWSGELHLGRGATVGTTRRRYVMRWTKPVNRSRRVGLGDANRTYLSDPTRRIPRMRSSPSCIGHHRIPVPSSSRLAMSRCRGPSRSSTQAHPA